jgi:HD-like signal output (HDOD) protein
MSLIRYGSSNLSIQDLLRGDVDLASPPEIFARLRKLLEEPDSTINMLAEVIEQDPAITARVLKLANSAFFALPHPVHSIAEAVSLVGIQEIKSIVLATEVIQRFDNIPEDLVDMYSYWRLSLRCAVLSRELGNLLSVAPKNESLFLAGLLHDIGHLVIYTRIPELGRKALLEHRHRGIPIHLAEQEIMGFDYAEVGASLAKQWELPDIFCSVLANHIHPEKAESYHEESLIVGLAHAICQAGSFDPKNIEPLLSEQIPLLQQIGISGDQVKSILPEAENAYGAVLALLH